MIRIDTAFDPVTQNIHTFFHQPGIGYYIPLYQREYTWDVDNIEQLLLDLSRGIENSLTDNDEIRFLGTIILVQETNPRENIEPQDPRGLPSRIDKVIDGQQRLSSIALLATKLHERISKLENKIPQDHNLRDEILQASRDWKEKLVDIFSLDLRRGKPERKPKIIRGSIDQWTMEGEAKDNYKSPVSNYLSDYISYLFLEKDFSEPTKRNKVGKNLKLIEKWLKNDVELAHVNDNSDFIPAWKLLKDLDQNYIWQFERQELTTEIYKKDDNPKSVSYILSSLVQLFSICHYLLDRCCFTVIQPSKDDWAFDLFQSLNATGTPLTAIETFSPLVVNTTTKNESSYMSSKTKEDFENIEGLFESSNTAAQKNKLTNDLLTSLAITSNGIQLSSHFSNQRKWLNKIYSELSTYEEQKSLINFFGNYSKYYKEVWNNYIGFNSIPIAQINSHKEAELCSILILFLKQSNHKMSITILGRFYNEILNGKEGSIENFVEACKLITSFYILWRSVRSNSGLDKAYREFFKDTEEARGYNWLSKKTICLAELRDYLRSVLNNLGIKDIKSWQKMSRRYLKYDNSKNICRMMLFAAFDQTIPDEANKGLMKIGSPGVSPYLKLEKWNSEDLKSIEHIAPQTNNGTWDEGLYELDTKLYQAIGNLTLLPSDINSSAGNNGWPKKLIYYKHISEKDPSKKQELQLKAKREGISLKKDTISILEKVNYNQHILPIVNYGNSFDWNAEIVRKRTDRILELNWNKLSIWFKF